ncbi:hypothetical protein [Bifidobacterium avesanii]|uniref:Uncharacterized protein n=1 Tax=Bifidobacterium avesanii TaxID=1798157 RepID=A0A7K3TIX8_9BIFI|nr:hypothetical protein [Bifidobacterium avesanii]KAB8289772.1 Cell surface glycoprotein 1 [Bifidobacterium avesanii]NEG79068.1 hypothetical protein [Bifidobacterium avesanii]
MRGKKKEMVRVALGAFAGSVVLLGGLTVPAQADSYTGQFVAPAQTAQVWVDVASPSQPGTVNGALDGTALNFKDSFLGYTAVTGADAGNKTLTLSYSVAGVSAHVSVTFVDGNGVLLSEQSADVTLPKTSESGGGDQPGGNEQPGGGNNQPGGNTNPGGNDQPGGNEQPGGNTNPGGGNGGQPGGNEQPGGGQSNNGGNGGTNGNGSGQSNGGNGGGATGSNGGTEQQPGSNGNQNNNGGAGSGNGVQNQNGSGQDTGNNGGTGNAGNSGNDGNTGNGDNAAQQPNDNTNMQNGKIEPKSGGANGTNNAGAQQQFKLGRTGVSVAAVAAVAVALAVTGTVSKVVRTCKSAGDNRTEWGK